eukprot:scaffold240_cov106-Skeletonema_dohrnii-CCMP3373.AAC.2
MSDNDVVMIILSVRVVVVIFDFVPRQGTGVGPEVGRIQRKVHQKMKNEEGLQLQFEGISSLERENDEMFLYRRSVYEYLIPSTRSKEVRIATDITYVELSPQYLQNFQRNDKREVDDGLMGHWAKKKKETEKTTAPFKCILKMQTIHSACRSRRRGRKIESPDPDPELRKLQLKSNSDTDCWSKHETLAEDVIGNHW